MTLPIRTLFLFALSSLLFLGACSNEPVTEEEASAGGAAESTAGTEGAPANAGEPSALCSVNGDDITTADIDKYVARTMGANFQNLPPEQLAEIHETMTPQILENLVNDKLLEQAASGEEYAVEPLEVEAELARFKEQNLPPGTDFEAALAAQATTLEEFRSVLETDMRKRKMLDVRYGIDPPDEESLRNFYDENIAKFSSPEQVEARHILIMVDPTDDEATKVGKEARAEELRAEVLAGGDFGELAKEHSDCTSAPAGGNLGRFGPGAMVPPFDKAAFALEPNVISEVVETQFGYHVIEVLEKFEPEVKPLEEVTESIGDYMMNQARRAALETCLEELRSEAEVEYAEGVKAG